MRIIPAIDIIDGKCVRLSQGDYNTKKIYNENPVSLAKEFESNDINYLHVVDLDGAKARKVINHKVLEADCKNRKVATSGWLESSDTEVIDFIKLYQANGVTTTICTDISKDGMLEGPSIDLYKEILASTDINLIASGGVSSLADLYQLKEIGCEGAILGKAIYEGKITLKELSALC